MSEPYGGNIPPQEPYGYTNPGEPPKNYLVWSIVVTLLCCLPLGVASIIFAAQVNSKWNTGDYAGAKDSSDKARLFAIISAVAGVVFYIIYYALGGSKLLGIGS
ncbi:MAG: CD225/dispanin family protein [Propionibacteriaceae bacterium]|jgi:hypothetical protein|nr:CD225/dispanin family protein [Propionibacteriaceae bacterium]